MRIASYLKFTISAIAVLCSVASQAQDLIVNGTGKAPITANIALTRETSLNDAKRNAVLNAVKKINGPEAANDPKIMAVLDDIAQQVGKEFIFDQSTSRDAGNNFITNIKLKLNDKDFRKLISDHGVAVKTANTYPILIVMDEYFTTPTDSQKPLREVVEMFSDKSERVKASQSASESATDSTDLRYSGKASVNASASGRNASASAQYSANVNVEEKASLQKNSQSASASAASLDAAKNDIQSYKKVVEYQPQNTSASSQSYTYEALLREAASYDLNVLDNSQFRSKYFTGKPLTLLELTNGSALADYVKRAFEEAKADYFMAGTTIIYDLGKNATSGLYACDGVVSLKAFSTTDSKILAADARTESASGNSADQCRVNVANKLAIFTAGVLGHQIGEYWKNRNMYGTQLTIQLISLEGKLNFKAKIGFGKAINKLQGVKEVPKQRSSDARQIEYSLQYSGETPIGDAIGELISNSEDFKGYPNFDVATIGSTVRICLEGSCPK